MMKRLTLLIALLVYSNILFSQKSIKAFINDTSLNYFQKMDSVRQNNYLLTKPDIGTQKRLSRYQYFMNTRVDNNGTLNTYIEEMNKVFRRENKIYRSTTSNEWKCIGPFGRTDSTDYSSGVGRMEAIWVSKYNVDKIYAGARGGGLWMTLNGGVNWECISGNPNGFPGGVFDIEVIEDPNQINPDIIYVISTIYSNGLLNSGGYSYGIYKSDNGGNSWQDLSKDMNPAQKMYLRNIELNPANENTIIAVGPDVVLKTTNQKIWHQLSVPVSDINFNDIEFDPNDTSRIIIAGEGGAIITPDACSTWSVINKPCSTIKQINVEFEKTNSTLYAVYNCNYSNSDIYLAHYDFSSNYWINDITFQDFTASWLPLVFRIVTDQIFYVGGRWLTKITKISGVWDSKLYSSGNFHMDMRDFDMAFDNRIGENKYKLFIAEDGGVSKQDIDTDLIIDISGDLNVKQYYDVALSKIYPQYLLAGAHDNGTDMRDTDGTWKFYMGGDGGTCYIEDRGSISIKFNTVGTTLYRNKSSKFNMSQHDAPVVGHPSNYSIYYATKQNQTDANYFDLVKSIDGGVSFSYEDKEFAQRIYDIAICESEPDNLYYSSFYDGFGGGRFRRNNSKSLYTWQQYNDGFTQFNNLMNNAPITSIEVNPDDPLKLWAGFGRFEQIKILYSSDGADTWTDKTHNLKSFGNLPINKLKYSKKLGMLLCGTDDGIYALPDGDTTWINFGSNLPFSIVSDIEINDLTNEIIIATYSRGLWSLKLDCSDLLLDEQTPTNYTWDNETKTIDYILKIPQGQTLTIQNNSTIKFSPYAKIIVEPGGKLIIDNSILTSVSERLWQGIIVRGDRNSSQDPNIQGIVEIKNNSVIENAKVGIENSDQWQYGGGIIYASNSTFRNCRKCVGFGSYTEYDNKSYFQECVFECTGPLSDPAYNGEGTNQFVSLWQVYGVGFYGCTFRNAADYAVLDNGVRGTGIVSIEAGYDLKKTHIQTGYPCDHPDGTPNKFYDLDKAISCSETYTNNNPIPVTFRVRVLENEFYNNSVGIEAYNDFDLQLYGNTFKYCADQSDYGIYPIPAGTKLLSPVAISTNLSKQLNILENQINFVNNCNIDIESYWAWSTYLNMFVGMVTGNTGSTYNSSIYFNQQTKSYPVYTSQYLFGDNSHLQLSCNEYIGDAFYDWYMDGNSNLQDQATNGNDPRNTFSSSPCGGSGIPYNSFVNYSTPLPVYNKFGGFDPACKYNIDDHNTLNYIPPCAPASYCDIYPEMNGGGGEGGGTPSEDAPPLNEGTDAHILHLIYAGNFTEAENEITSYISDSNLILFLQTVKTIYSDGRNYMLINPAEETVLGQLALHYDKAGYYSQSILNLFSGETFPPKPLNFELPEQSFKKAENEVSLKVNTIQMNIYPNPANNNFTISYILPDELEKADFRIYNMEGREILNKTITGQEGEFILNKNDLSGPGMYQCIITTNNDDIEVKKVLIIE